MVKEAEAFADEDKEIKLTIESRNRLESYIYQLKGSLSDSSIKGKLSPDDEEVLKNVVSKNLEWMEKNMNEKKEVYDRQREEISEIVTPIMKKIYESSDNKSEDSSSMPAETNSE